MMVYTESVFLPKYGVEIVLMRTHGQRWWVAGSMDMEGSARERARNLEPRGSVPVAAYALAKKPET